MTSWTPDLARGGGPIYRRLAEEIERAIAAGQLSAGHKLPPQRDLAYDLGITIGTVGRAYALARERGLVSGEVGRGTYVRAREEAAPAATLSFGGTRSMVVSPGRLRMDSTAAPDVGQGPVIEALSRRVVADNPVGVASYTRTLPDHWQEAGSRWLAAAGWRPAPESVVPTLGGHAAVMAAIGAVTAPGERIALEALTYAPVARGAHLIGRRVVTVALGPGGMDAADFERLCRQQHPKLAFIVASLHNPTLAVMDEAERRAIAETARRHDVWIVEDNVYGTLLSDPPVPIAALAPERTFHVGSLSKAVAAGVRGGWVSCPPHLAPRVLTAHKMLSGGLPFLLAELAAALVLSGEAAAIRSRVVAEIGARVALARSHLAGLDFTARDAAPFVWLRLPEPWLSGTFRTAAAAEGVLIDDEDEFKPARTETVHHRARIALTVPHARAELAEGLATIRRLTDNAVAGYDSYS
ncbi:PLP-dependent aminotransferase family protein [Aquibium sp. A9E412]|uniref:aminotransferase-like domain-containing protein n=1 Tax=Aquibium sp. A9E412 TaxID=2976767 RepID=UPI0025AF0C41|nr:PLP-dependent aminotransferase family protein [Aquibium sp. A9E412]MDN2567882.1 PLP-dependent aminotransferase family protein [Aquibium sp. A9E412]